MIYYLTIIIIIVIVNFYKKENKYEKSKTCVVIRRVYRFKSEKKHLHGAGMVSITFKNNRLNYNEFFF